MGCLHLATLIIFGQWPKLNEADNLCNSKVIKAKTLAVFYVGIQKNIYYAIGKDSIK